MSRLLAFGSSPILPDIFTTGEHPFPKTIADKLSMEYVARGKKLNSNSKIARKILSEDYQESDCVLVCWTSTIRFEFRTEHGWTGTNRATYKSGCGFEEHWYQGPGRWEYTSVATTLKEILLAQTHLSKNNIPYLFTFDNNDIVDSWLYANPDSYLKSIVSMINWDHVIWFDGNGFMPWARNCNFEFLDTHPGAAAHIAAADYLIEKSPLLQSRVANPNCG